MTAEAGLLKLKAKDAEDLQIVSAVLQDSIAPVVDMAYRPEDKNFIMIMHRLRREAKDAPGPERICCAVNLRGAESVQAHGIDLEKREQILELLALMLDDGVLHFVFAGGAQIRVTLGGPQNNWSLLLEDFGDAWPASCSPCHDAALKGEEGLRRVSDKPV